MPSVVERAHEFDSSWEATTTAFWNKYPNPELSHVKDAFVLERFVDSSGVLHSKRLIHMDQNVPAVLRQLSGGLSDFYAVEESTVDPIGKVMVLKTRNLTYSSLLKVEETCVYSANDEKTQYNWRFKCTCMRNIPGIKSTIERTLTDRAYGNSGKGLDKMRELAVVYADKFEPLPNQKPRARVLSTHASSSQITPTSLKAIRTPKIINPESSKFDVGSREFGDDLSCWYLKPINVDLEEITSPLSKLFPNSLSMLAMLTSSFKEL